MPLDADALRLPLPSAPPQRRVAPLSARRERVLVKAAQRGDRAAVEALFRAHWPGCCRAALLVTGDAAAAEDVAQEAFLAALGALDRFDRRRPLGPWLRTIAARRAIDFARARAVRREVGDGSLATLEAPELVASGLPDDLLAAIAALPPERREVVVLRHLLELAPREIAGLLGVPVGTVNSRLRRALDQLRAVGPFAGALVVAAAVAAALAIPGPEAVARWVAQTARTLVGATVGPRPRALLTALPGGGHLLVDDGLGRSWIAGQGALRPIPGSGGQAAWSAFGHYVAVASGRSLRALALDGRVAWARVFPARVAAPAWSPDGQRVAFRMGTEEWVIAGDGTGAHPVSAPLVGAGAVPAAWRPGPGHVLAYASARHRVSVVDADSGSTLRRLRTSGARVALLWAAGGHLVAVTSRAVRTNGRPATKSPYGVRNLAAAMSPSGRQLALLRQVHGTEGVVGFEDEVTLSSPAHPARGRVVARGLALGAPAYSPDGRWLLVPWPEADSFLFVATAPRDARVRQVTYVSRRFGGGKPAVTGWCCLR